MPSARSSPSDPVGMTWTSRSIGSLPSRMIAPLPNCLSIAASARAMALSRAWVATLGGGRPGGGMGRAVAQPHDRALAELLVDRGEREVDGLVASLVRHAGGRARRASVAGRRG